MSWSSFDPPLRRWVWSPPPACVAIRRHRRRSGQRYLTNIRKCSCHKFPSWGVVECRIWTASSPPLTKRRTGDLGNSHRVDYGGGPWLQLPSKNLLTYRMSQRQTCVFKNASNFDLYRSVRHKPRRGKAPLERGYGGPSRSE